MLRLERANLNLSRDKPHFIRINFFLCARASVPFPQRTVAILPTVFGCSRSSRALCRYAFHLISGSIIKKCNLIQWSDRANVRLGALGVILSFYVFLQKMCYISCFCCFDWIFRFRFRLHKAQNTMKRGKATEFQQFIFSFVYASASFAANGLTFEHFVGILQQILGAFMMRV